MRVTRLLWSVHLIALAIILVWAIVDLRFESMLRAWGSTTVAPVAAFQASVEHVGMIRPMLFVGIAFVAAATLAALIGDRFRSSPSSQSRSLRSLLAIAVIVAMWCSVAVNIPALAWQGNRVRLGWQLDHLEAITEPLREDWPARDGDIAQLGPFMAYPFGRPTVLVLLASPTLSGNQLHIAAIERSALGAIKLQLSGTDHDDWAEWHPPGSQPASFVGGLSDQHELESSATLGSGWSLARYRS